MADVFGAIPYAEFQSLLDDPPGQRNWWTAEYLDDLPDGGDRRDLRGSTPMPAGHAQLLLVAWGGADRARAATTPLAIRDARVRRAPVRDLG